MNIDKLKQKLIQEKELNIKGSIYHYSQVLFSYNSNKIEGSKLTEKDTKDIFETRNEIIKDEDDDLIETKNHFKLFDYILDMINEELSKEMLIEMHKILKRNTTQEKNKEYNVGGFKKNPNIIGIVNVIKTSTPKEVEINLDKLIKEYNCKSNKNLEDIIDFHYNFETIHPFSDGNGRIGRIIMYKECLKNNIIPFIIFDQHKDFYLRGLKEYKKDKNYLLDTCKLSQDNYENIYKQLID